MVKTTCLFSYKSIFVLMFTRRLKEIEKITWYIKSVIKLFRKLSLLLNNNNNNIQTLTPQKCLHQLLNFFFSSLITTAYPLTLWFDFFCSSPVLVALYNCPYYLHYWYWYSYVQFHHSWNPLFYWGGSTFWKVERLWSIKIFDWHRLGE